MSDPSDGKGSPLRTVRWRLKERILSALLNFVAGILIARHLGAEGFGILHFGIALVGMLLPFASLGLKGIVVRELVSDRASEGAILGTVAAIKSVAGGLIYLALVALVLSFGGPSPIHERCVLLIAAALPLQGLLVADQWLEARAAGRAYALAHGSVTTMGFIAKISAVWARADITTFAFIILGESVFQTFFAVWVSRSLQSSPRIELRVNPARAKTLLRQSWPLLFSAFGAAIYLKIDLVMMSLMRGDADTGIYAAAARLSEGIYFLPAVVMSSIFPFVIRWKANPHQFEKNLQGLFDTFAMMAGGFALLVSVGAGLIIGLLYGDSFDGSVPVLRVHVWACLFVFMGEVLSKMLIIERFYVFSFCRHLVAASVNVGLNWILIPAYGPFGAAVATLLSYGTAHTLMVWLYRPTRPYGKHMLVALWPVRSLPSAVRFVQSLRTTHE